MGSDLEGDHLHELENRARQNEFRAVEQREPAITPLERDTQQRESEALKRESTTNRFIDTIKQFAGGLQC